MGDGCGRLNSNGSARSTLVGLERRCAIHRCKPAPQGAAPEGHFLSKAFDTWAITPGTTAPVAAAVFSRDRPVT